MMTRAKERKGRKEGNFRAAERRTLSLRGSARKDLADTIFTACPRKNKSELTFESTGPTHRRIV